MGTMIPFPRTTGRYKLRDPQQTADAAHWASGLPAFNFRHSRSCANGMPGHPPCRSVAELEAMLRERADVTAAREGV